MKGSGSIFWMRGQTLSAEKLKVLGQLSEWHSFLTIYKDHNLVVVDPGYIAQARDDEKRSVHKSMRGRLYLQGGENVIGKGSSKRGGTHRAQL